MYAKPKYSAKKTSIKYDGRRRPSIFPSSNSNEQRYIKTSKTPIYGPDAHRGYPKGGTKPADCQGQGGGAKCFTKKVVVGPGDEGRRHR